MTSGGERLLELVEQGMLDPTMAITMCVKWMSGADIDQMLDAHELSPRFMEDYQDD